MKCATGSVNLLFSLLLLLCTTACQSHGGLEPEWVEPDPASTAGWMGQPHSWERLDAIEEWLVGPGPEESPHLVPEAELSLAEGRLRFARDERSLLSASTMRMRLRAAESGFKHVLADSNATSVHRLRAQAGMKELDELAGSGADRTHKGSEGIQPRSAWNAARANPSRLTPNRSGWTRITVHHSAEPDRSFGPQGRASAADAIERIQKAHMKGRNYGDIGYHFLIDAGGRIWAGRSMAYQGAHSGGSNNVANIGICLLGNFDREQPTSAALASLDSLIDKLSRRHRISSSRIYGHQEMRATECPGEALMRWVERRKSRIARR